MNHALPSPACETYTDTDGHHLTICRPDPDTDPDALAITHFQDPACLYFNTHTTGHPPGPYVAVPITALIHLLNKVCPTPPQEPTP